MPIRKPTLNEITELNEILGEGRMACERILRGYFNRQALKEATTFEDLKEYLLAAHPASGYQQYIEKVVR